MTLVSVQWWNPVNLIAVRAVFRQYPTGLPDISRAMYKIESISWSISIVVVCRELVDVTVEMILIRSRNLCLLNTTSQRSVSASTSVR